MLAVRKRQRSLADIKRDVERLHEELDRFIEDRVSELKASPSARDLPINWIRADITRGECRCQTALRLIDNE